MKKNKILAVSVFIFMLLFSLQIFAADGKVTLSVAKVEAEANTSVYVPIVISDNTGICGAILEVSYDRKLTLTGVEKGEALSSLTLTSPGNKNANPARLLWDGLEADDTNGEIVILTFNTPETAGTYDISISYEPDEVTDGDFVPVDLDVINGSVTVVDGLLHTHEGGEATCSKKAVCSICGEEYGDYDLTNHKNVVVINKKDATDTEEGYTGDIYCSDCETVLQPGEVIPVLVNGVIIRMNETNCRSGKEVTVPVMIENNTGIAGFSFDISYDDALLTLKNVKAGSILTEGSVETNENTVNWYTADNISGDGELLQLVFEVSKDAPTGETLISIAPHEGKDNLVNENGEYVPANYPVGIVKIRKGVLGDINEDEDITIGDVVLLNRSVLGKYTLPPEVVPFADVNDDGEISIGDVVILNRHVLGKESIEDARAYLAIMADYLGVADPAMVYVEDVAIKPGATIGVPVIIEDNTGIAGLAFSFTIPEGFVLNSITKGELLTAGTFSVEGNSCTWYSTEAVDDDGVLLTLNITATESAQSGSITVTTKEGELNNLTNEHGGTVVAEFASGSITVNEASDCDLYGHEPAPAVIENEKEATCLVSGSYDEVVYCSICKEEISRETRRTGYADHDWAEDTYTTDKKPTCLEDGIESIHCRLCGTVKPGSERAVEKTGHKMVHVDASEPGCETDGNIAYWHCAECEKNFLNDDGSEELADEQIRIESTGHTWDEGVITKEPTPQKPGERTYTCSTCLITRIEAVEYVPPTTIHDHAFAGNQTLTTVTIGNSITEIEDEAFAGCENLEEIFFEGDMPVFGKDVFKNISKDAVIYYPADNLTWNEQMLQAAGINVRTASWDPITKAKNIKILSDCTVTLEYQQTTYDGLPKEPEVTVKDGQMVLKADKDYTVAYGENVNAGDGTLTITGWENYTGTVEKSFLIGKEKGKIEISETEIRKNPGDSDFDLTVTSLVTDGTVSFSSSNPEVASIDQTTGHVKILSAGSTTLTATANGVNYTTEKAQATLTVVAPEPVRKENTIVAADFTVQGTGKAQRVPVNASAAGGAPLSYKTNLVDVSVTNDGYISIPGSFAGKAVITITAAETKEYKSASKTISVIILPGMTNLSKVKTKGSRKVQVTWKSNASAEGYELQYSTSKKFTKKPKTVTISRKKTIKRVVKKLKGGKRYFFRIRSFITVDGVKYYSDWSKAKRVKVKK